MNILLTNDDGVHAEGLNHLYTELKKNSLIEQLKIVAPATEKSTTGHSLTLTRSMAIKQIDNDIFSLDGFPADCVVVGTNYIFKDLKFDLVISGINKGANLGQDIFLSGTVGAARQACMMDIPSISTSLVLDHYQDEEATYYGRAAAWLSRFVEKKGHRQITQGSVFNFNFPNDNLKDNHRPLITVPGFRHYTDEVRVDEDNPENVWIAGHFNGACLKPGTDSKACGEGYISLSVLEMGGNLVQTETQRIEEFFNSHY